MSRNHSDGGSVLCTHACGVDVALGCVEHQRVVSVCAHTTMPTHNTGGNVSSQHSKTGKTSAVCVTVQTRRACAQRVVNSMSVNGHVEQPLGWCRQVYDEPLYDINTVARAENGGLEVGVN